MNIFDICNNKLQKNKKEIKSFKNKILEIISIGNWNIVQTIKGWIKHWFRLKVKILAVLRTINGQPTKDAEVKVISDAIEKNLEENCSFKLSTV